MTDLKTIADLQDELDFISREEVAEMLEMSGPRVSQMVRDGILTQDGRGRYPRRETIHSLFRWFRERLGEGKSNLGAMKSEARRMENELLQIAVEKARGSAIQTAEVDKAWENIILLSRQAMLGIPNKLAPRMPYLKSEVECEAAIREEIESALSILSRPVEYSPEEVPVE